MAKLVDGYNSLHSFSLGCPCFSFDILRYDVGLGRSTFPHTVFGVAGTRAWEAEPNYIGIFKLSNLSGQTSDLVPAKKDAETPDTDSDSIEAPILQLRKVFHDGFVYRIRAMSQNPHICASWADTGYVQVWDLSSHLNDLVESTDTVSNDAIVASNEAPLVKFKHEDEGFALDWSPLVPGRLVSGDCKNFIHLWEPTDATWNVDANPFVGHTGSVEDLQWSPTMPSVFASCSGDGSIAMWDIRLGKSPTTTVKANEADVNVISWKRLDSNFLASGSDDGSFSIWDVRSLKEWNPMERFEYHKHAITSIEWSPHETSVLAVSSYDDELSIWDLLCETHEDNVEFKGETKEQVDAFSYFPELVCVHRGQNNLTELHWHPQIPAMVISTSHTDGFDVIIPTIMAEPASNADTSDIVEKLEDLRVM